MNKTDATRISYVYVRIMPNDIEQNTTYPSFNWRLVEGRREGPESFFSPKSDTSLVETPPNGNYITRRTVLILRTK